MSVAAPRRRRALAAAVSVSALAGMPGCALMPASVDTSQSSAIGGVAARTELLHVPFHPQLDLQCGPAALATALGADGVDVGPSALVDQVFLPARGGSLQAEMLAGARRHGRVATRIPPTLAALVRTVAASQPVVVLQNLGLSFAPAWHYAVVVGYDLPRAELLLRSGGERGQRMSMRTFGHTWARSDRWGFVVHGPDRWPDVARRDDVEAAAVGFERTAPPAVAARAYAAALERHPGSLALALGLGNTRHAAGDLAGAAEAFAQAAQRHDSPPAWINLALTQRARGDVAAARRAAEAAEAAAARPGEDRWRDAARAAGVAVGSP